MTVTYVKKISIKLPSNSQHISAEGGLFFGVIFLEREVFVAAEFTLTVKKFSALRAAWRNFRAKKRPLNPPSIQT